MRNYDYNKLLDARTFEYFAKDIIEIREDREFEIFSEGKDKGIDLRNIEKNFLTIVQVKRSKDFKNLWNELKSSELEKVKKLKPDRYILVTSSPISVVNADKIKELFIGCHLQENDIIGCEKLNSLLEKPEYKKVEDEYYQLWINSTRTLDHFVKKNLNADVYAYTKNELENIKQSAQIYVQHDNFKEALNIIKEKRCLLICGEPEIGKSTLARNLCAYLMNQNRELEFIYHPKLSRISNLFNESPQLFFIDDFWGSRFDGNLNAEAENELKKIIEMISKSKNKILILTSREYILEQGYAKYPELEEFFDAYKLNLHIEDYSDLFKARILFKHLANSTLPELAVYEIANGYEWIIYNENYRPRLIENYINYVSDKEIEPDSYLMDFKDYLNQPYKLWKEIFEKQQEGAQIITILILLLNKQYIELEYIKTLYENYIEYDTKTEARKKDFGKYIAQLENTLITTYVEEWHSKKDVFVKFKNSSIELYIYKHFMENIGEYGKNIIQSTPYINILMYLAGSWNILEEYQQEITKQEGIYYDITNHIELMNEVKQRIMRDLDTLIFLNDDLFDGYTESEECYVHKLIMCVDIYNRYPSEDFKNFLEKRIVEVLKKLEKEKYFDYDDLFSIPRLVDEVRKARLDIKIDIDKTIEDVFQAIRFSRQIFILEGFEEKFPNEYEEFYNKNKAKIISAIYNLTLGDAEFFIEDAMYDEIYELRDMTIPSLFEKFKLKYTKDYMNEFYDVTDIRLQSDTRGKKKKDQSIDIQYDLKEETETKKRRRKRQEELEKINQEKEELIQAVFNDTIEKEEAKEFFEENIKEKRLVKELTELFDNYDKNYIRGFMEYTEDLEALANYINILKRIPKDSHDFFQKYIECIIEDNENMNKVVIGKLGQLAYNTFKEGRNYLFKRELLEVFKENQIEEILESKLVYQVGKKYYFQTIYFHLYLALDKMIEKEEDLFSIYDNMQINSFKDLFNDICYIYSDLDLEKFNTDFLLKQIQKILNEIQDEDENASIRKLVSKYKIKVELNIEVDLEEEHIYQGGSCFPDASLLAIEYLGFDMWDMACESLDLEEIKPVFKKAYKDTKADILLQEDLKNKRTLRYKVLDKLGYPKYLKEFYKYLLKCEKDLKQNPNLDLRKSFTI